VTLPSGCGGYPLSLRPHIDTSETTSSTAHDKLTVKVGATTPATCSSLNKASGYNRKSFKMSAFAGQTVTLTFTGAEDLSLQASFVIDDTAITVS
jgi:hypothetical protein